MLIRWRRQAGQICARSERRSLAIPRGAVALDGNLTLDLLSRGWA